MSGMILPAGGPLVQFEHTSTGDILWIDRRPTKEVDHAFDCDHLIYRVMRFPARKGREFVGIGTHGVCLCMGRFIE